ncbi:hypothetical protein [Nocardia sp. NPDC004123]
MTELTVSRMDFGNFMRGVRADAHQTLLAAALSETNTRPPRCPARLDKHPLSLITRVERSAFRTRPLLGSGADQRRQAVVTATQAMSSRAAGAVVEDSEASRADADLPELLCGRHRVDHAGDAQGSRPAEAAVAAPGTTRSGEAL